MQPNYHSLSIQYAGRTLADATLDFTSAKNTVHGAKRSALSLFRVRKLQKTPLDHMIPLFTSTSANRIRA